MMPYKCKRVTVRFTSAEHAEYKAFMRYAKTKDWTRLIRVALREYKEREQAKFKPPSDSDRCPTPSAPARLGDPVRQKPAPRPKPDYKQYRSP